jgi:signal peptidase
VSLRDVTTRVLEAIVVVVLVSLVVGAVLGQPVLLSYVETGSMAPTLAAGDGFVAVPSAVAGEPSVGDVVVFRAETLQGGGLTTHRIVAETEQGYVTRGDANPFTDQDGGEPPVTEDRIVAKALQVGGTTVVIPHLGTAILAVQGGMVALQNRFASLIGVDAFLGSEGVGLVLFGVGIALFALSTILGRIEGPTRSRNRSRRRSSTVDTRRIALALLVVVLVPANVAMVLPSGTHEMTIDGETVASSPELEPGDPAPWEYTITNQGIVPLVVMFETENDAVSVPQLRSVLAPGDERTVTVGVDAPPPGASQTGSVREYRYLLVLPPSWIETLHEAHPVVAWATINGLLAVSLLGLLGRPLGLGVVRVRGGSGVPLSTRLRRRF